ncbi:MAG: rhodanese-like domain-containing protein [Kofleriaceae bacterium]
MRFTLLIVALLAATIPIASCSRTEPPPPPATKAPLAKQDPAAARALIAHGAVVIDVRTPEEFADGHLPTATDIAVEHFGDHLAEVDKLVGGDKSRGIVVYCAAGSRAARAKKILDDAGYQHVVNGGGYDDLR